MQSLLHRRQFAEMLLLSVSFLTSRFLEQSVRLQILWYRQTSQQKHTAIHTCILYSNN